MIAVCFEPNPFHLTFTFNDSNCEPDPTGGIPGQQTTCGTGSFDVLLHDTALNPVKRWRLREQSDRQSSDLYRNPQPSCSWEQVWQQSRWRRARDSKSQE